VRHLHRNPFASSWQALVPCRRAVGRTPAQSSPFRRTKSVRHVSSRYRDWLDPTALRNGTALICDDDHASLSAVWCRNRDSIAILVQRQCWDFPANLPAEPATDSH
jgi:hypothetical protein